MFSLKAEGNDRRGRPKLLTVTRPRNPDQLAITVELGYDRDGPYPIAVTVKKDPAAGYEGGRTLSGRDIQRLSLGKYLRAAVAYATAEGGALQQMLAAGSKLDPPRRSPQGSKPPPKWLAEQYVRHERAGRSPAQEIAKQRGVPVNRVYQWFHQERQAGRLPASSRRGQ
jgi:hypothetical protein